MSNFIAKATNLFFLVTKCDVYLVFGVVFAAVAAVVVAAIVVAAVVAAAVAVVVVFRPGQKLQSLGLDDTV